VQEKRREKRKGKRILFSHPWMNESERRRVLREKREKSGRNFLPHKMMMKEGKEREYSCVLASNIDILSHKTYIIMLSWMKEGLV